MKRLPGCLVRPPDGHEQSWPDGRQPGHMQQASGVQPLEREPCSPAKALRTYAWALAWPFHGLQWARTSTLCLYVFRTFADVYVLTTGTGSVCHALWRILSLSSKVAQVKSFQTPPPLVEEIGSKELWLAGTS